MLTWQRANQKRWHSRETQTRTHAAGKYAKRGAKSMFKCYILAFALCTRILPFSQTCYTGKYLEYRKKMYVSHSTPIWAEIVSQYFIYFAAQIFFLCAPFSQAVSQAACQVKWACGLHKSGVEPGLIAMHWCWTYNNKCVGMGWLKTKGVQGTRMPGAQTNGEQLLSEALYNRRHSCNARSRWAGLPI